MSGRLYQKQMFGLVEQAINTENNLIFLWDNLYRDLYTVSDATAVTAHAET